MAKTKKIDLNPSILAKLMLLERFYTESYRQLARIQGEQGGKPSELALAEESLRRESKPGIPEEKNEKSSSSVSEGNSQQISIGQNSEWLSDPGLKDWIESDPPLSGEDLRPYFYFSRDLLGPLNSVVQRMSPIAQEILSDLLKPGKAQFKITLKRAKDLSSGDSGSVFFALGLRLRTEDDLGKEESILWKLLDWVNERRELFGQLIIILMELPETNLPLSLPPRIVNLSKSQEEKSSTRRLLEKWNISSGNPRLKASAKIQLSKI